MEDDSWSRFCAASKHGHSTLQSRFDLYLGFEDVEGVGYDDSRAEFACPFCAEDFDIVGLCCHIDEEHPADAKNGVCPVCADRVGMDMVRHITTQHRNFFKVQRRRRFRKGSSGSHSTLSLLRKELHEGNLQSLFGGSSYTISTSNAAPDPLLSLFITNLPAADSSKEDGSETLDVRNVINEAAEEKSAITSNSPVSQMARSFALVLAALVALALIAAPRGADGAISCGTVTQYMSPCINYLRGAAPLTAACCSGVGGLNSAARSTPDRQQACGCLKSAATKISAELSNAACSTFILDAEVVAVDRKNGGKLMSFQDLSSRERGSKDVSIAIESIKVDICVFVFDIMFSNGDRLLDVPLRERRIHLKNLFQKEKPGFLEFAKEITVEADEVDLSDESTLTKINTFFEDACKSSCEGIMAKSLDIDAVYCASKRSDSWLKVKRDYVEGLGDSLDLVPIGAWHGNGRKAGWYSPFLMACYSPDVEEFQSVCRVMSGFSDSFYIEMKDFFSGEKILSRKPPYYQTDESPDIWFFPEMVWEIRGSDLTISPVHHAAVGLVDPSRGISVRLPRFIRLVSDRKPEDCSTSSDVACMFNSQTRKKVVGAQH